MTSSPILNPELPLLNYVKGGLFPGKMVKVQGRVPEDSIRFAINYQLGSTLNPRDDIAIHMCPRFTDGFITRNHLESMTWGPEENFGPMVIHPGQGFEIIILCHHTCFKVAINGQHYADFRHRLPYEKVTYLVIDGDVEISSVFYETIPIGPPPSGSMPEMEANFGPPPPGGVYPTINPQEPRHGGYGPQPGLQQKEEDNEFMDKIGLAVGGLVAAGGAAALANALHKRSQNQEKDHEKRSHGESESGFGGLGALGAALASSIAANAMQKNSHSNYPAYPSFDPNNPGGMLGSLMGALGGGGGGGHAAPPYQKPGGGDPLSGALSGILGGVLGGGNKGHQPSGGYSPTGGYAPSGGYGQQQQHGSESGGLFGGLGAALGSSLLSSALDSLTKSKDKHRSEPTRDYYSTDRTQSYDHRYDDIEPAPAPRPKPPPASSGGKMSAAEISKGLGLSEDDD